MEAVDSALEVEVVAVADLAAGIRRFDLARCDGDPLPDAAAGAHINVRMAEGLTRPYSLLAAAAAPRTYSVAVKHEPAGSGGSHFMHTQVRAGMRLLIEPPVCSFPLVLDGRMSVFLAGGIGITPIWSMIQECERRSQPWRLYYAAQARSSAAFLDALCEMPSAQLFFPETEGTLLDIADVVRGAPADAHLYCCGPAGMIAGFRTATADRPSSQVHIESFAPTAVEAGSQPITLELARSGRTLQVAADKTILETLLQAGIRLPFSCRQGICGNCEVEVLDGDPDHRDAVLSEAERESNTTIITCCSRSKSGYLVLNL
jgi:ferredoxin-NADP reductase